MAGARALLRLGEFPIEMDAKTFDVFCDLPGFYVGEEKAEGVSAGCVAEHLCETLDMVSGTVPNFGFPANYEGRASFVGDEDVNMPAAILLSRGLNAVSVKEFNHYACD